MRVCEREIKWKVVKSNCVVGLLINIILVDEIGPSRNGKLVIRGENRRFTGVNRSEPWRTGTVGDALPGTSPIMFITDGTVREEKVIRERI